MSSTSEISNSNRAAGGFRALDDPVPLLTTKSCGHWLMLTILCMLVGLMLYYASFEFEVLRQQ